MPWPTTSPEKMFFALYKTYSEFDISLSYSAIAVSRPFGDSVNMTVQEVHIDTTFCLSRLTTMWEDTLLAEEVAYHPNLRRTRITAKTISLILNIWISVPVLYSRHYQGKSPAPSLKSATSTKKGISCGDKLSVHLSETSKAFRYTLSLM